MSHNDLQNAKIADQTALPQIGGVKSDVRLPLVAK